MRILLLLVLALASGLSARAQEPPKARAIRPGFASSNASLELNGRPVGMLKSFSGGNAVAEVVTDSLGTSRIGGKRLGAVSYEPIVLEVSAAMAPEFWATLQQWPNVKPLAGAILIGDVNLNVVKRLDFSNAVIGEIAFPSLDAASKEAFSILLTLVPGSVKAGPGSGRMTGVGVKQKSLLTGNFRLSLDGVDTARVNKIDTFVLKQKVATNTVGEFRRPEIGAAAPEIGDLIFTASEAGSESLQKWFDSSVMQGKNEERNGKIELLGPDLKSVLFSITLRGMGIYRLAPEEGDNGPVRRVEARLYVESATIDPIK